MEGVEFRIVFRHDRSRKLADHIGHDVNVIRKQLGVGTKTSIVVFCSTCKMSIAGITQAMQKRRTWCAIQYRGLDRKLVSGAWVDSPAWFDMRAGFGTPNEDAGDQVRQGAGAHSRAF
jgi:hypothetical protein